MNILGIDPGKTGGFVLLDGRAILAQRRTADVIGDAKWQAAHSQVSAYLRSLHAEHRIGLAVLELYAVRAGEGRGGGATTGVGWGLILGVLSALEIPVITPASSAWTRTMLRDIAGEGKDRAVSLVGTALPDLDLKPGRCRTPQSGLADAGALALYGQTHPLGRG